MRCFPILCLTLLAASLPAVDAEDVLVHSCQVCHANVVSSVMPSIRAASASSIARKLRAFRDGTEEGTVMPHIARGLSEQEIEALSRHFANSPP